MVDLSNENMIHVKEDKFEYLQFRRLAEYKDIIKHGIFFKPLDFYELHAPDDVINMSYRKVFLSLGLYRYDIVKGTQAHKDKINIITEKNMDKFYNNTDGYMTNDKNIGLAIVTADCIAFILFDPVKKVIANIHSGWKGTAKRIVKKAINEMIANYDCDPKDIICCISPSIGKCHFEVKEDVKNVFEKYFKDMLDKDIIVKNKNRETFFIDLILINRLMLLDLGLKNENIIESGICTACASEYFHSFRIEKKLAGRNMNIISLIGE